MGADLYAPEETPSAGAWSSGYWPPHQRVNTGPAKPGARLRWKECHRGRRTTMAISLLAEHAPCAFRHGRRFVRLPNRPSSTRPRCQDGARGELLHTRSGCRPTAAGQSVPPVRFRRVARPQMIRTLCQPGSGSRYGAQAVAPVFPPPPAPHDRLTQSGGSRFGRRFRNPGPAP
jgi:hypothetical protein